MLTLGFKRRPNDAIESNICFAVIKQRCFKESNRCFKAIICVVSLQRKCSERNCMLKENSKNIIQSQLRQIKIN